jgi:hypothetical protein
MTELFVLSPRVVVAPIGASNTRARWPDKAPGEALDFDIDWTRRLYSAAELEAFKRGDGRPPAEAIRQSEFRLPPGLVARSSTYQAAATKIWLAGGELGRVYQVINRIETVGGRAMVVTVRLKIKAK